MLTKRSAYFTYDPEAEAYYFAPTDCGKPPYRKQVRAEAILDVDDDGRLVGVELVLVKPLTPPTEPA